MRRGPILIVDDDLGVRELISLALENAHEVRHAGTAAQALAVLRAGPAAALVLDHRLPDGTGLELLVDIRAIQPDLPVILVTGYGSESVCASAFKQGIWDYFAKPMDILDLAHSVHRAVASNPGDGRAVATNGMRDRTVGGWPDLAIQKVTQLVQHRYWDRLSLGGLAREVGMSKYRLSHRFTEVMGLPLREYVQTVRLERAKEMLSGGRASITDVAQTVGFSDLPRFDKLFKRYTGLTPSAYRSLRCSP